MSLISQVDTLQKDANETESQFQLRRKVYDNYVKANSGKEKSDKDVHLKGVTVSNVFTNVYFMGCSYPEETIKQHKPFWPTKDEIMEIMA